MFSIQLSKEYLFLPYIAAPSTNAEFFYGEDLPCLWVIQIFQPAFAQCNHKERS